MNRFPYLLFLSFSSWAQEPPGPSEPFYGLPASFARNPSPSQLFWHNPAAIKNSNTKTISLYSERSFGLSGLSQNFLSMILPVSGYPLGIYLCQSGPNHFREFSPGLSLGLPLAQLVRAGLRVNYHQWKMPRARLSGVSAKTGFLLELGKELNAGILIEMSKLADYAINGSVHYGLSWEPGSQWQAAGSFSLFKDRPAAFQAVLHYQPLQKIMIDWGYLSDSDQWYMSIGFRVKKWITVVSGRCHPYLGWTPGIQWTFIPKTE